MATYEGYPIETDPTALAEDAYLWLQERWPTWLPDSANFDAGTIDAHARMLAELRDLAANVPDGIFKRYGPLAGVPVTSEAPAVTSATLTAIDAQGYTLEAGAVFGIRASGDVLVRFTVDADVTIAPGGTVSAVGEVDLTAEEAGADANGLGGAAVVAELVDRTLPWLSSLTLTAATTGGATEEPDPDYLDRLATELQLAAPRPIAPEDFSVFAKRNPAVDRAVTIDLYQPAAGSGSIPNGVGAGATDVERAVTVYVVDEEGLDPGVPVRTAVQADLDARREVGFLVYVGVVVYQAVSVTFTAKCYPAWDPADVEVRAEAAVAEWLSPRDWGVTAFSDERDWVFDDTVRLGELVEVLNRVEGLWRVTGPGLNGMPQINGAAADLTLTGGKVVLPTAGTIAGTVTR